MIWSRARRCCFVHIPKTGGTSIATAYEPYMLFDDVMLGGTAMGEALQRHYRARFRLHKHSGVRAIRDAAGGEDFAAAFSFAVIRDPVARLVSLYRWLRAPEKAGHPLHAAANTTDFAAFAGVAPQGFGSQAGLVTIGGQVAVTRLYRFEDLPAAWADVAGRIGVPATIGHANAARSERIEVSAAVRAAIEAAYAEDVALWRSIPPIG